MNSPQIPLLFQQLTATLQMLILLTPMIATDDLVLARTRLSEANLLITQTLGNRERHAETGKLSILPCLHILSWHNR